MKEIFFFAIIVVLMGCSGSANDAGNPVDHSSSDSLTDKTEPVTSNDGKTIEYHPNGNIKMEGRLNEKGQRDGLWISYYENGTKWSESYYVDGLRDGHNLSFFPNGRIRYVGEYKNDKKVGTWKFYNEDGSFATEETY